MIEAPPSPKPSTKTNLVPANSSPMIAVRSLVKRIGQQEILCGVDLDIASGETLAIIGRSGAGRSVLLRHLVRVMAPDAGDSWTDGQDVIGLHERQRGAIRN